MNKRLGSAKTTMFNIGGVAALKNHAFFESLDWTAVYNCEYKPPIDLSQSYAARGTTSGGSATASANSNTKQGISTKNGDKENSEGAPPSVGANIKLLGGRVVCYPPFP